MLSTLRQLEGNSPPPPLTPILEIGVTDADARDTQGHELLLLLKIKAAEEDLVEDFINIDCGVSSDYNDPLTGFWYQRDTNFIETGENHNVEAEWRGKLDSYFGGQLKTLRSFPEGKKNCYTFKVKPSKQGNYNNYLIRTYFAYGNYDGKNQTPTFDLYIGINYLETIDLDFDYDNYYFTEAIHTTPATTNTIHVCLVKGIKGIPLISALELRPLSNSIYTSSSLPSQSLLNLKDRFDVGCTNYSSSSYIRYKDDIYDRLWRNEIYVQKWQVFNTSVDIDPESTNDSYKLPQEVLKSAAKSLNVSTALNFDFNSILIDVELEKSSKYYVYFHFAEIEQLGLGQKRVMSISVNNKDITSEPLILEYLKPMTIMSHEIEIQGNVWFNISATSQSDAPPILNAFEIYELKPLTSSPTHRTDGRDLSFNDLSGPLPESLADLPKLRFLDLTNNKLTGSIPKKLKEKSTLQLRLGDNPDLCLKDPCKKQKNYVIPLVASISALIVILLVSIAIWIFKTKKLKKVLLTGSRKELKNRAFSYSQVLSITNNLQNLIGEGGFGKVYLGTLNDDTQVAVKLLSQSSNQGHREFLSELELLMVVHHKHLVSLIGYCEEDGGKTALIYEYMAHGDLRRHLSDKNPNTLKWKERLQIALDSAYGLDYLHNGCKPPIVHRDLKTSNILLNENMQAKIADFGLSRTFENEIDSHISTRPAGTFGYLDPEYQTCGNLTRRSDVYSFGIILLELITGQPAVRREGDTFNHILQWVTPKLENGDIHSIVDPRLQGNYSANSAWKFVDIAMSCTAKSAIQRSDISQIVVEVKECLALEMSTEKNMRKTNSSSSLYINSMQFDSDFMPSAR
ncbi:putative LRR receptor-like serine/threonine-protein kinase [Senna tora]|uniref:Putative LRR receptor-like serine/threonine-protein kinase n=1 Tax=Senna tora TaxID=362788 RepID=A0A834WEF6_9FABA|nr:putative LRR receptor-like serine/threonine-protein kinase [Senna tora]